MASASTTEITAFESQSDPYKSLKEPRNIESHVKVTIFFAVSSLRMQALFGIEKGD